MKRGFLPYLLCVLTVALFTACDDSKGDEGVIGLDLSVNAKVIKSITEGSGQAVTNFIFANFQLSKITHSNNEIEETLTYNSSKKLTNIVRITNTGGITTNYNFSFIYGNSGELTKLEGVESSSTNTFNVTVDYTYDAAGKIVKVFTTKTGASGSGIHKTIENTITYSGANISKKVLLYLDSANGTTTSTTKTVAYSNYDANKNPFTIFSKNYGAYSLYFENGLDALSANNYSTVSTEQPSSTSVKNYTYTYNANGSPLTRTENGVVSFYDYQSLF